MGRNKKEGGAALVEFAILMPLLVLMLVGMVELGWGLAQQIDVRHKAREALRLVIVDAPEADIQARVCTGDIVANSDITELLATSGQDRGSPATVTVTASVRQLTGLFSAFWGSNPTISSTVEGRVEQETAFASYDPDPPCP